MTKNAVFHIFLSIMVDNTLWNLYILFVKTRKLTMPQKLKVIIEKLKYFFIKATLAVAAVPVIFFATFE